jgi:1-acyl-sn-glycerol-3-phosphate acyltransferase
MRRFIAQLVRLITGVRRLAAAPTQAQAAIYYANHGSHLDFVVIWAALPPEARARLSPAAAEDYWGKTERRRRIACNLFQAVLIPREGITRENNPIERLAEALQNGRSILIFPEGTRRTDGSVGEFRAGLFHLAKRFPGLPLVPVCLENLSRILPKGSLLAVPLIAQAHFREPIAFDPEEGKNDFLRRARAALLAESPQNTPQL